MLDYERFNRNNFSIRFRSWYYRGCWHQTCPPIDPRYTKDLICAHSDRGSSLEKSASLSIVTTSPCQEWVIFAPAAFLGCGSRFSCSLSGIEPLFPATRYHHGRPGSYRRQLIRQTFIRSGAGARPCARVELSRVHQGGRPPRSENRAASAGLDGIKTSRPSRAPTASGMY